MDLRLVARTASARICLPEIDIGVLVDVLVAELGSSPGGRVAADGNDVLEAIGYAMQRSKVGALAQERVHGSGLLHC